MADEYVSVGADDYFTHMLQAYGVLKNDPSQRRAIADAVVEFLKTERTHVDFASPAPEPEIHVVAPAEEDTPAPVAEDDTDNYEEVS